MIEAASIGEPRPDDQSQPDLIKCLCLDPQSDKLSSELERDLAEKCRLALVSHMIRVGYPYPLVQTLPTSFESWWELLHKVAAHEKGTEARELLPARNTFSAQLRAGEISAYARNFIESIYLHHFPAGHSIRTLWNHAITKKPRESAAFALEYVGHMNEVLGALLRGIALQFRDVPANRNSGQTDIPCEARFRRAYDRSLVNFSSFRDQPTTPKMVALPSQLTRRIAVALRPITLMDLAWSGLGDIKPSFKTAPVTWDEANEYLSWLRKVTGMDYRLLTRAEWQDTMQKHSDRLKQGFWSNAVPCREFVAEDWSDQSGPMLSVSQIQRRACIKTDIGVAIVDATHGVAALRVARFLDSQS